VPPCPVNDPSFVAGPGIVNSWNAEA